VRLRIQLPESTFEWESNVAPFRVGRGDSCALRFEGEAAKYASWEHAEFSMNDGVAYVTDLGSSNGTFVEGVRITEAKPLWTGAVVQIGGKGPRLEVLELTRPAAVSDLGVPPVQQQEAGDLVVLPARHQAAQFKQRGLVIGLAVALLAVLGFFLLRKGTAPELNLQQVAQSSDDPTAEHGDRKSPNTVLVAGNDEKPPSVPVTPLTLPEGSDEKPSTPIPPRPADPWKVAKEAGLPAYRLIVVEDPRTQTAYPLAGAVIVGEQALLTTADVGIELATMLGRAWRVKAARDSQDDGVPIDRVRIYTLFQDAKPEERLFFNMAVLYVKERLTGAATLASATELAAFERGQPLLCVATSHSGDAFNRFEEVRADAYQARVFTMRKLSAARMLFLRGPFGDNAQGSPLFNDLGHLVALYCEAAPAEEGVVLDHANHYATIIEPQLITQGMSLGENPYWVAPVVPPDATTTKEPAK
jgi:pSer/pThr/pTyr-binding forkhead associated (FHA) protein